MKHLRLKPGMSLFACAACALGLLLWARLLLVSSPPRIATAQPAGPVAQPGPAHGSATPVEGALTAEEEKALLEYKLGQRRAFDRPQR